MDRGFDSMPKFKQFSTSKKFFDRSNAKYAILRIHFYNLGINETYFPKFSSFYRHSQFSLKRYRNKTYEHENVFVIFFRRFFSVKSMLTIYIRAVKY